MELFKNFSGLLKADPCLWKKNPVSNAFCSAPVAVWLWDFFPGTMPG